MGQVTMRGSELGLAWSEKGSFVSGVCMVFIMEEEILVRCFLVYTCFQLTTHQFSKKWVPFRWKVVCCKLVTAIVKLIYGWASPVHLVLLGNLWLLECPLPQLTCRPCFLSCGISFSLSSFSAIKHINVLAMSGPSPLIASPSICSYRLQYWTGNVDVSVATLRSSTRWSWLILRLCVSLNQFWEKALLAKICIVSPWGTFVKSADTS